MRIAASFLGGVVVSLVADGGVVSPLPTVKTPAPPAASTKTPPRAPAPAGPPQLDPSLIIGPAPRPGGGERRYDLRPAKDGTGDLLDEAPGYTAHVKTDGTVRFADKGASFARGLSLIPFMPLPIPGNPSTLQGVAVDLLSRKRKPPQRPGPSPRDAPDPPLPVHNPSRYRPDPREACAYGDPCFWYGNPLLSSAPGQFDATDEIMRFNGKDPYRYDKALFLAGTREVRIGMAVRALADDVRRAAAVLDGKLIDVGCDETRSRGERRAILSALSAELDGDTPAARAAVEKIRRFIAAHLGDAPDAGAACGVSP
jgi:hypothetical protein